MFPQDKQRLQEDTLVFSEAKKMFGATDVEIIIAKYVLQL